MSRNELGSASGLGDVTHAQDSNMANGESHPAHACTVKVKRGKTKGLTALLGNEGGQDLDSARGGIKDRQSVGRKLHAEMPRARLPWILTVSQPTGGRIPLKAFDWAVACAAMALGRKPTRDDLQRFGPTLEAPLRLLASARNDEAHELSARERWDLAHELLAALKARKGWVYPENRQEAAQDRWNVARRHPLCNGGSA